MAGRFRCSDDLGAAYEAETPLAERIQRGQYYTPASLCDFMLSLAEVSGQDKLLEPGCGTGAFLMRAYDRISATGDTRHEEIISQLYGIELDPGAAAICARQLTALGPLPDTSTEIRCQNFLDPLPRAFENFDIIIANPPYVRQENWDAQRLNEKSMQVNSLKTLYWKYLSRYPEQEALFHKNGDLYLWFILKATLLLKPQGRLCVITSGSWLSTGFGKFFQRFLDHHYEIQAVIESAVESWFADAAITPVILLLVRRPEESPHAPMEAPALQTRLIRLLRPLVEILPDATVPQYWHQLQRLTEHMLSPEPSAWRSLRLINQSVLTAEEDVAVNWGFHLRSSSLMDVLPPLNAQCWTPLKTLGEVRYPVKTGINEFFYLSPTVVEAFGIEPEFLTPALKSSKSLNAYTIRQCPGPIYLFTCPFSLEELARQGKHGALSYIQWGEGQVSKPRQKKPNPIPWPEVPSVQGRSAWYQLSPLPSPDILCFRFFDRRYFFPLCETPLVEDQTFYGLTLFQRDPAARWLVAAILNATVSCLFLELSGRASLGDGVLQFSKTDMASLRVLTPEQYTPVQQGRILEAFRSMTNRKVLPFEKEMAQEDRQELDRAVLSPLSLSPDELARQMAEVLLLRLLERKTIPKNRRQAQTKN